MSKVLTTAEKTKAMKAKQQNVDGQRLLLEEPVVVEYLRGEIPRRRFMGMVGEEAFQVIWDELVASIAAMTQKVKRQRAKAPTADEPTNLAIMGRANSFILWNFPFLYGAGPINRVRVVDKTIWVFPIVLTSPGYGIVCECGHVAVDVEKDQVIGCTPRDIVIQRGRECEEQKKEELEAAFLRARRA
jgi:hypothetical protein